MPESTPVHGRIKKGDVIGIGQRTVRVVDIQPVKGGLPGEFTMTVEEELDEPAPPV